MKREILNHKRKKIINGCCPGHDDWPDDKYGSSRSQRARRKSIAMEHKYVRTLNKRQDNKLTET